jgi:aldehyde dehydrogenase (NAD+)
MTLVTTPKLYIDGQWTEGTAQESADVINPATEEVIASVPVATSKDVEAAVAAARTAFDSGPWPQMTPTERAKIMLRMADEFDRRREELVDLNVAEAGCPRLLSDFIQVGTPISNFRDLVTRVVPTFDFERAMRPAYGNGISQGMVVREPYGVAALVTAFNFPFYLNLVKVGPALAAGCTAVLKPSPYTPLQALVVAEVAEAAGLPPGVLNVVTGDIDAGETLTRHEDVDIVSFTGSDTVGRKVYGQSAESLKKVLLELGGKSANILLDDVNLDDVMESVLMGFITHAGQGCGLFTRILVHESLHDELVARVKAALEFVTVGNPADPGVVMGPLIREVQRQRVEALIQRGVDDGAEIAYGGGRPANLDKGFFVEPTLFVGVDNSMEIARKEFFGPVAVVIPFRDDEEAVRLANDSEFGLAGGVWSADAIRGLAVARRLRVGAVTINGAGAINPESPFGGYKDSGFGREGGEYGLSEFLQHKAINWRAAKA